MEGLLPQKVYLNLRVYIIGQQPISFDVAHNLEERARKILNATIKGRELATLLKRSHVLELKFRKSFCLGMKCAYT